MTIFEVLLITIFILIILPMLHIPFIIIMEKIPYYYYYKNLLD